MRSLLGGLMTPVADAPHRDALAIMWLLLLLGGIAPVIAPVMTAGLTGAVLASAAAGASPPPSPLWTPRRVLRSAVISTLTVALGLLAPVWGLLMLLELVRGVTSARSLALVGLSSVGGVLMLASVYLVPVVIVQFDESGRLRVDQLRATARSSRYLLRWLGGVVSLSTALVVLAGTTTGFGVLPLVGRLITAYLLVLGAQLIGRGIRGHDQLRPEAA